MKAINRILLASLAAAATLLGGCEKETDITVNNTRVAACITSTIDAMATRAAGTTWAVDDAIGITTISPGYTSYTNIKYRATTTDGVFIPTGRLPKDTIFFWDKSEVTFKAYYPYEGKNGDAPGTNADGILLKAITATDQTPDGQAKFDYLFATAKGSVDKSNVELRFTHRMSRIVLNFIAGDGLVSLDDFTYTVTGLPLEGTFDTNTGDAKVKAINTSTGTGDLSLAITSGGASTISSTLIVFPMEMPSTPTRLSIIMNQRTYGGNFKIPKYADNSNLYGFQPGYSYSYNVRVNNSKLVITLAEIENWKEGDDQNINIKY